MSATSDNREPEPRYSVSGVAYAIAALGYPDGPDFSPDDEKIRDLVEDGEFAAWLKEVIEISSDPESPNYQPDSVEASEAAELDAEIEWRATKTLDTLTTRQQESLMAQVQAEFPREIFNEVRQIMPIGGNDEDEEENVGAEREEKDKPAPPATPPYQVTALNNFDWYEDAGVPTACRDAEHALSVAKGILERSLAHEHGQAKDPTSAAELFDRWDSFGDFPSIYLVSGA